MLKIRKPIYPNGNYYPLGVLKLFENKAAFCISRSKVLDLNMKVPMGSTHIKEYDITGYYDHTKGNGSYFIIYYIPEFENLKLQNMNIFKLIV